METSLILFLFLFFFLPNANFKFQFQFQSRFGSSYLSIYVCVSRIGSALFGPRVTSCQAKVNSKKFMQIETRKTPTQTQRRRQTGEEGGSSSTCVLCCLLRLAVHLIFALGKQRSCQNSNAGEDAWGERERERVRGWLLGGDGLRLGSVEFYRPAEAAKLAKSVL